MNRAHSLAWFAVSGLRPVGLRFSLAPGSRLLAVAASVGGVFLSRELVASDATAAAVHELRVWCASDRSSAIGLPWLCAGCARGYLPRPLVAKADRELRSLLTAQGFGGAADASLRERSWRGLVH